VENKFGQIYIEVNGKLTKIQDLKRPEYEYFLQIMQSLIIAYKVIDGQETVQ
jgi:hypothetical protein